jgi:uncharacterized protein (TIGR02145 family)
MTYNTVRIGSQCWLRENINLGARINASGDQTNNSTVEKYCYIDNPTYCNTYGGLYQWAEAVQYLNGVTNTTHWSPQPTNVQGICPTGWHIPTEAETATLFEAVGGITTAGGALKEMEFVHWNSPNSGATNAYGFTFLPSGDIYNHASQNMRLYGWLWTVDKGSVNSSAKTYGAAYNLTARQALEGLKVTAFPVRCLKD